MINAIISVYYPTESVRCNVNRIADQVDRVYICDNSSVSNRDLFSTISPQNKIVYIAFCENLGISAAFNRVLRNTDYLWETDDYVIFFDQDSCIQEQHIARMICDYEKLGEDGYSVGCLGPVYYNTSNSTYEIPKSKKAIGDGLYSVSSIITSSMLCRYGDLKSIDFWNEEMFLDMADWDICWRLEQAGMLCCLTQNVVLQHSVGSGEKRIGPVRLRVGQPVREYYQIRDGMYLFVKRYAPWKFRLRYLAMISLRSMLHILFLDHRKERLHYILKGFKDAIKKRKGVLT